VPAVRIEHLGERSGAPVVHGGVRDRAAAALEAAVAELAGAPELHGLERRLEASSSPAFGLHDLAEAEACDVIVVGSSHRGAVGRAALGTVADRLL
jgi:nucleotide-binding universal stress UspA family protein